jgi:hypothetical protein
LLLGRSHGQGCGAVHACVCSRLWMQLTHPRPLTPWLELPAVSKRGSCAGHYGARLTDLLLLLTVQTGKGLVLLRRIFAPWCSHPTQQPAQEHTPSVQAAIAHEPLAHPDLNSYTQYNRVRTSTALRGNDMWNSTIGLEAHPQQARHGRTRNRCYGCKI